MFRILLLITGILITKISLAQEWLPIGATWYYNQAVLFQGETYRYLEITGDTTVKNKNCKILNGVCDCSGYNSTNFLFQDTDRIYLFIQAADSFRLLYDFTLSKGDTIFYKGDPEIEGDGSYLIDSVTSIQAGPLSLRVQYITRLDGYLWFGRKIIERIGSDACFFPIVSFCDPGTGPLRCYEDSEIGLIKFQDPEKQCDYISVGTSEPECNPSVKVYPNPAPGAFYIESTSMIQQVEVFDLLSQLIYQNLNVGRSKFECDVVYLPSGVYFIKIKTASNNIEVHPLIVNKS